MRLPASTGEIELEDRLSPPELPAGLPDLERRAVMLRFHGDLKQHEIGRWWATPRSTSHACCAAPSGSCRKGRRLTRPAVSRRSTGS
jgi:hypothetical protein